MATLATDYLEIKYSAAQFDASFQSINAFDH